MKKVAVFGASGFVGAALVERLQQDARYEVVPVVRSSGNAWRVARLPLAVKTVDLMAPETVKAALEGCTHVVNCTRGDDKVMLRGFRTLLEICAAQRVERFVHLSSVAVYGDPPPPDSQNEDGQTNPVRGTYGWVKLEQDRQLQRAARGGLSSVSLCPPNISGAYSPFMLALLAGLRQGRIPLVDGGQSPCNLVDVDNLTYALQLALERGPTDGRRLFVTDNDVATWTMVLAELRALLPQHAPAASNLASDALRDLLAAQRPPRASLWKSAKHLVSSDVREVLRRDPLLASFDRVLRGSVALLGTGTEERLRLAIEPPGTANAARPSTQFDLRLAAQQFRKVVHSPGRAIESIGYQPPHSFAASMAAFRRWQRTITGAESRFGGLYAEIRA